MKTFKIYLIVLLVFSSLFSTIAFAQSIEVEEYELNNGLTVILHEDHYKPEVFGVVVVRVGAKNDPEDATGMAHYQEHMLFKGTGELGTTNWEKEKPHINKIFSLYDDLGKTEDPAKRKELQKRINEESLKAAEYAIPNELSNLIKSIGGTNLNAGTGTDITLFYSKFPPNQIEKWLELYSHTFINPVFRLFQAELEVVYEEKNMYNDIFITPLLEEFDRHFFKQHPYGQQTILGTVEDLKNPSLTKMYEFFKKYYIANNMALVLVGDFNSDEVKPLIEKKFGKWQKGDIPEQKEYIEEPFAGRELIERRMSPVKLGLLGFRTPPARHEDEIAFDVCNGILTNQNGSGLLDKLTLDNKLLAAQLMVIPYNDFGCAIIFAVPKILGQKLEEAETLVLSELENLRNGNFDDWMVDAIKTELYKDYMLSMESNKYIAQRLAIGFSQKRNIKDVLAYPEKIKRITKEDVIRVANKYYGNDYLAFFSKMGFPKKIKIDKPGYEPVVANTNAKSAFTKRFEKIRTKEPMQKFIDFEKDIQTVKLQENLTLFAVENPKNNIFTLTLKFGVGGEKLPLLKYASEIMNYSGTKKYKVDEYKKDFSKIGCSYNIKSDDSYTYIEMNGVEEKLPDALKLISLLLTKPELEPEKLNIILDETKAIRKMEQSKPDNVGFALFDFVRFKNKSPYIDRLKLKEIKKLNTDSLVNTFLKATKYQAEIHYCGTNNSDELKDLITSNLKINETLKKSGSPVVKDPEMYQENAIYFVNKKSALQGKIGLFINGKQYEIKEDAHIDAFNMYFGGGFSGLVMQEIREYRSLAYVAGAGYITPALMGKQTWFIGYLGTQADKSNEAIEVFVDLIRNMPEKNERMDMIKNYLSQSALTKRPGFRDISETVEKWKLKGYTDDPSKIKIQKYEQLLFDDIVNFYNNNIKEQPLVICIVGDKKRIDMEALKKYGKIIKIKEKKLFTK